MRSEDIDDLMDQIDDLKKRLQKAAAEKAEDVSDEADKYSKMWREKARMKWTESAEKRKKIMVYIKSHPWTWAMAGFVLGAMIAGKATKHKCKCED
jgi:ElaB/YqjD/DUF883 family membrane-anchored ribosome-binding protein